MAHQPPYADSNSDTSDDSRAKPNPGGSSPSTPRWVKVFGLIALVLVLLFVILNLTGAGFGGHTPPKQHGVHQP